MQEYELSDFLEKFLAHQRLHDFWLVLEPRYGARGRRRKRANTLIQAFDPCQRLLRSTRSVHDLLERLFELAPEVHEWVDSGRYKVVLYADGRSTPLDESDELGALRDRSQKRAEMSERLCREHLRKAFRKCDGLLDPSQVDDLALKMLAERKG
jgi:hypothetical protein